MRGCWSDSEKVDERRRKANGSEQGQEEERRLAASGEEEDQELVAGKVFVDLTFAGGLNGRGAASSTGSTSSTQNIRGTRHWDNHVQDVIKSTRFLVNQVAAKADGKKEGEKLRIYGSKNRSGAR